MSKKSPQYFLPSLEKIFFKNTNEPIGDIPSRLYGVQRFPKEIEKILQENPESEVLNVEITKILQDNANISQMTAYQGHSIKNLGEISAEKLRKLIESNLDRWPCIGIAFYRSTHATQRNSFSLSPATKNGWRL